MTARAPLSALTPPPSPRAPPPLLPIPYPPNPVTFSALIKGVSILGPVRTAIIATVEPFFTAVLGVVVLGARFTVSTLIGGLLIGGAILVIELSASRDGVEASA